MNYPCKDCTERSVGCHIACTKYLSAKTVHDAENSTISKIKAEQKDFDSYKSIVVISTKKKLRKFKGCE